MRINSKLIMTASALLLALTGIALSFLPGEIAAAMDASISNTQPLIFQILGALYFAFAMLNWMAKGSVIGGIYNRPIAIANFTHFLIGGLALVKVVAKGDLPVGFSIAAGVYTLFALLFGVLFYTNPVRSQQA